MTKPLKLYGERNTSTNYLRRLLRANLDVHQLPGVVPQSPEPLLGLAPSDEWARDLYFTLTFRENLGWKHSLVKSAAELRRYGLVNRGVKFITITKNPYSWLLSLYRQPYHRQKDQPPDFESFLRSRWQTVRRDGCGGKALSSPIELWNIKNASYLSLSSFDWLALTTEELVRDPAAVIDKVATEFDLPKRSPHFVNIVRSTKDGSKNYAYYRRYYLEERWRDDLSEEATYLINDCVDTSLMDKFGYRLIEPRTVRAQNPC